MRHILRPSHQHKALPRYAFKKIVFSLLGPKEKCPGNKLKERRMIVMMNEVG